MSCLSAICIFLLTISIFSSVAFAKLKEKDSKAEEKWKKKDIRDYSEADLERLYDQWEDNDDEELPEDELPEWKKEPPKVDLSNLDPSNPEALLKASKKGRTLMMFATVSGDPTEKETEQITGMWHSSLFNANKETQRYVVGSNRVIFMLKDGAMAWEIKDFLIDQDRCEEVTIEGQSYPGKGAKKDSSSKTDSKEDNKTKKKDKTKDTDNKNDDKNRIKKDKKKTEL
ncbi:hypothetical protein FSP39_009919 [Pinctada imbricata]|uniref:LDLR chaperone MESD n=1 Tax=Pinctada imbricata TaxID=66713 RepID=A0AA89C550_PINIB|nr:hypothetical protein FSP39_009919 [Pinctada imbricata]